MALTVRFGNLTVEQFEKRTEVRFTDEDRAYLEEHRQDSAQVVFGDKFHIFSEPLGIEAGADIVDELIEVLKKYDFKKRFTVSA